MDQGRLSAQEVTRLRTQFMGMARRLRREARTDEESWARLLVLGAIDRHGEEATPSVLAASENMRSSNLATALRDLEGCGLIVRTPDSRDRRRVRVALTEIGRKTLYDNRARREQWLTQAMETCLTTDEIARLIEAGDLIGRLLTCPEPGAAQDDLL